MRFNYNLPSSKGLDIQKATGFFPSSISYQRLESAVWGTGGGEGWGTGSVGWGSGRI